MEQGADQPRRKSASARPPGRSDFPSPSSPFSRRYEDGHRESRRRVSDGTIAWELGAGGGDEKEDDVYDFLASRSSRRRHSSSSKKLRDKKARKLTPKDRAPMTLEERTAEILARTRSASSAAPVSVAGGGGGGVGGSGKGDTTSPAGESGARAGDGAGTFSDFAKSLREFQGDLDLSAATTGGAISKTAERGPRESEALLQMSGSLVIDETDMEVGGYARARGELRQSKEGVGTTASASARSRSSPVIAADATGTLPREKIPGTLAIGSEGSDDCTGEGVVSGGDGQGQAADAGRKGTGSEGGKAGSDTCYEDDGFEAEVEEEKDKEEDGGNEEKVKTEGGEAWKVLSGDGTEDTGDVDGGGGRCDGADARGSSGPLRFQGASTNSSTGDAVDGEGERGEGAGFPSGAEASIVGAISPRYLLASVAVSGRVFPTSPGGRSALSLPPAPPDSPPPSPLSSSFVAAAAAAVPAAEDKQFTGGRAREIDRAGAKIHSSGKSVSEAAPARGEHGACGLVSAPPSPPPSPPPPPPRHPPPGDGGGRDHCDSAIDVSPASHEVGSDAILSLRRDQNERDRSGAALDVAGLGRDGHPQLTAPVSGRGTAATPAPAPVPALELSFVMSEGRFDGGGSRSSINPHYRRIDGSPPPVSSPSRGSDGGGAGVRSTRDRRPQPQGQRIGAPQGDWRVGGSHAALSGLSWDDVGPGSSASIAGQEEQLGTLSPLGGGGCASSRRQASSIQKYPSSERGRLSSVGNISTDVGFADRERSRAVVGYLGINADAPERERACTREGQARSENRQRFGHAGSAAAMDDLQGPTDLSSVVLMSSLSSTPGRRRSGSGRWAAGHDQVSTGRADLAVVGLPAANCWERTTITPQAERGFQDGAEIAVRAQEKSTAERRRRRSPIPTAAARDTEDSGPTQWQQQQQQLLHVEADRRREETERELEKARAEIYALQVKLKEKRAVAPARTPTVRDHGTGIGGGIGGRASGAPGDRERNSFGGVSSRSKGKENGRKPVGGDATPVVEEAATAQAVALASMEALRAEAEGMRREIAEQDRLLSAYQKENEKLLERAKKDKAGHEEERLSLYRDRERLNKELNRLANEKGWAGIGAVNGRRSANAVQARLEADAELVEARARQADLTLEVDRLRTVEKALEAKAAQAASAQASAEATAAKALSARAASVATGAPSSAAEGLVGSEAWAKLEGEVERLEGLLTREREERSEETAAARKRLDWYAGNQELLDSHLEKMREQEQELDRLRQALSSRKAGGKGAVGRSPSDVRKIKDLEAQLGELAEALRKRHPDSLASLIRAARPTESQDMRNQNHLGRIRELETELARNKEESELRLRALRQQHERLKIGMEKRLEATKRSGREGAGGGFGLRAARAGVGGNTGLTQREKSRGEGSGVRNHNEQQQQQQSPHPKEKGRVVEELEKELGRVRSFYTRKLKETERRAENQMRALKRGGSGRGGGGDSNRLGAEDGRSVHGRDGNDAARMTRRDEADGKLLPPGGKREHEPSATTTAAVVTGGRVEHGARPSPPPFAGRIGGDGNAASSSAAFGSPSAPAASSPPVRQTASSSVDNRRASCRDPREAAGHRQDGEPGARGCGSSELGLGSEESIGSNVADVLKAERARHERELEREREAAAARVAALELRLVQTAQALGKAQAREQAELWGRAGLSVDGNNASVDTRRRGEDLAEVEARARERERQQQQQQQEKARELELKIALARERQAAAAKDLERSEDMRKALEVEVLGLRAKLNEPSTPSQAKYLDLSRKVEEMERRTARREVELQRVLSESREHSKLELRRLQTLHAEEMRAKDALVHGFRGELDALMMAAGRLMEGGGSGGKAGRIATDRPIGSGADGTEPAWGMVS